MKIKLLAIGKTDDKNLQTLIETYQNRLKHYINFELEIIADIKNGMSDRLAHLELLNAGIDSLPLSIYYEGSVQRQALVLGFSGVQKKVIPKLVTRMGRVLGSLNPSN